MKCFVTGAAGFVGTNLTLALLGRGDEVIGVDSLGRRGSEKNAEYIKKQFPNFGFRQVEIEDIPSLVLLEKPDLIYHFAAQVAVTSSLDNPLRDFKINGEGTANIAIAAGKLRIPIIYTSTNKVYGDNVNNVPLVEEKTRYDFLGELQGKGIPENFPIDARHHTPYGCSKLVGDIYVREFGGLVNRCSCMYGPYQNGIVDQGWLSHLALSKLLGRQITIYGDGKQVRDVLHSRDVVDLLMLEGERILQDKNLRGEVFNIGGGYQNNISLLELCRMWDLEPKFEAWRPADQKVYYSDISKAKRCLGWYPKIGVDEGLEDLLSWTEQSLK